jgi:hypothetical protein
LQGKSLSYSPSITAFFDRSVILEFHFPHWDFTPWADLVQLRLGIVCALRNYPANRAPGIKQVPLCAAGGEENGIS